MKRGLVYFAIFAITAAAMAAFAMPTTLAWSLMACDKRDAPPDAFLAECNAFGNFEHGAYFYGFESAAVELLKQADVLFLGNSHLQYALSTDATNAFFATRGLRHYLLGFGYNEGSVFIEALAERHGFRPHMLVINADPFFSGDRGVPAKHILGLRGPLTWIEYFFKSRGIALSDAACARFGWRCTGEIPAIYRMRATGHWRVGGYDTHQVLPIEPGTTPPNENLIDKAARRGVAFLETMAVDRRCVVLTGIPGGKTALDEAATARAIGERLGVKVLNVALPDMDSIDGRHMTRATAERWSEAFFVQLAPLLEGCPAIPPQSPRNTLDPPASRP